MKQLACWMAGVLQADVYGAYESCAKANSQVERVACWAHVRRKLLKSESAIYFGDYTFRGFGNAPFLAKLFKYLYGVIFRSCLKARVMLV